jgi:hypothetical protein
MDTGDGEKVLLKNTLIGFLQRKIPSRPVTQFKSKPFDLIQTMAM